MSNTKIESANDRDEKLATPQRVREDIRAGKLAKQAEAEELGLAESNDDQLEKDNTGS